MENMIKHYWFSIALFASILLGGLTGYFVGKEILFLKIVADIFVNLILFCVFPLLFFFVASAIASFESLQHLWKMSLSIAIVFLVTGIIAALLMLLVIENISFLPDSHHFETIGMMPALHINSINLFFSEHIFLLILFSILAGFTTSLLNNSAKKILSFLQKGAALLNGVLNFIFYFAPIAFFSYFAVLMGGMQFAIVQNYFQIFLIYYITGSIYFIFIFSFYAYLAAKKNGVKVFWSHLLFPSITALTTCSSVASIPANLWMSKKIGIPNYIYNIVIPLGAVLHKEGSVLGGVLKILFLFTLFHIPIFAFQSYLVIIFVSLAVGTVMGAIPSGGMIGEIFILSFYHLPMEALMMIAVISLLIDPLATLINVVGDCAAGMLIARLFIGKNWYH